MMNKDEYILLDTNSLGYFLNEEPLELSIVGSKKIVISEITEMEIQCDKKLKKEERRLLKTFLDGITIVRLNDTIRNTAVKIRLTTSMKLMDSIIAATSQFLSLPMVTSDDKFDSVKSTTVILLPSIDKR
jgi:predicted nucleic acid-binding protein